MTFEDKLIAAGEKLMDQVKDSMEITYYLGGYASGTPYVIPLYIEERMELEPSIVEAQGPDQVKTAEGLISDLDGGTPDKGDYLVGPVVPGEPVWEATVLYVLENDGYFFKVAII